MTSLKGFDVVIATRNNKGPRSVEPSLSITEGGRIRLNSAAKAAFGESMPQHVQLLMNKKTGMVAIEAQPAATDHTIATNYKNEPFLVLSAGGFLRTMGQLPTETVKFAASELDGRVVFNINKPLAADDATEVTTAPETAITDEAPAATETATTA